MSQSQRQPHRLLEQMRAVIRARHYSLRTEETYLGWVKRFIWMLDPLACQHVSEAPKPRLSVDALVALRDLLDQHPLLPATSLAIPGASQLTGDSDAPQSSISPPHPEPATLRPPHRVAAAPRSPASP